MTGEVGHQDAEARGERRGHPTPGAVRLLEAVEEHQGIAREAIDVPSASVTCACPIISGGTPVAAGVR